MEAPERLYAEFIDEANWSASKAEFAYKKPVTYIREDLLDKYTEKSEREELFKQVALAVLNEGVTRAIENRSSFTEVVADFTDEILKAAKKFGAKE